MRTLSVIWTIGWMGLLLPALAWAQASDRVGTFKNTTGDVRLLQVTQEVRPSAGQGLRISDRIITGPDGFAVVLLRDGTTLSIGPKTHVNLSTFEFNSTTQEGGAVIQLLQGSLRVITGLLGKLHPDRFKVTTPTSVVGVRGTDFIVKVNLPSKARSHKGSRSPKATIG